MRNKDIPKLQQDEELDTGKNDSAEKQGVAKKASLAIFMLVLLLFVGVMFVTYFVELKYGKTAGTAALIIIAVLIAGYLYRQEIMEKLKRKK